MIRSVCCAGRAISVALLCSAVLFFSCTKTQKTDGTALAVTEGLRFDVVEKNSYASQFRIYRQRDYTLIAVQDGSRYLVVAQGATVPEELPSDIVVLQQPVRNVYMATSSALALWRALDALPYIRFCSTQKHDWYIEEAEDAMERGSLLYAGKYSAPNYELLLQDTCQLAVESTMILHSPKTKERLEAMNIPVFIDTSSREEHPLGRLEWIKVYGALLAKETEAEAFFERQVRTVQELGTVSPTGKTVAFFYINQKGMAVVRRSGDYISQMIDLAGATYRGIAESEEDDQGSYTAVSLEQFYHDAADADFLIYNTSMGNQLADTAALCARSEIFADFAAVKARQVWTVDGALYQATDSLGDIILDIHKMVTGAGGTVFLERLE